MTERKKLLLRLDPVVYEAVARWAGDDLRSVNAQIEYALRVALRSAGRPVRGDLARPTGDARPTAGRPTGDARPTGGRQTGDARPTGGRPTDDARPTGGRPTDDARPTGDERPTG